MAGINPRRHVPTSGAFVYVCIWGRWQFKDHFFARKSQKAEALLLSLSRGQKSDSRKRKLLNVLTEDSAPLC